MNRWVMALLVPVLLGTAAAPAVAGVGDVVVGGVLILRIRAQAGGISIEERARIVEQRITNALSRGRPGAQAIAWRMVGGQPAIFAGDIMIITVDANHARLNATTRQALADLWVRNLREALPRAVPLPVTGPTPSPSPSP